MTLSAGPGTLSRGARWLAGGVALACGLVVFVVLSHFRPLVPPAYDAAARAAAAALFLAAALAARATVRFRPHWPTLFAFFVASAALFVDFYVNLSPRIAAALGQPAGTAGAIAIDKLESSLVIVAIVLVLNAASGGTLSDLRLAGGHWRRGLAVGGAILVALAAAAVPVAGLLFGAGGLTVARALPWAPWVLLFVLTNAVNEEVLFRGLVMRRLEPLIGGWPANIVVTIVFVLHHNGIRYTPYELAILALLVPLSLAWGWMARRDDSVWGAVLFHAGMDIPVALGLFANL